MRPLVWAVALVALGIGAVALLLRTEFARERARVLIVARVSEALGREIVIGRVEYEIFPTTFVFHDVVVPGDRPGAADFARARRIEVEADFEGLRQRVLELRRLAVEGLDLVVELRADGDNLPRAPRGAGGERTLAVSIGGVSVEDARVRVDERTVPVEVEARAVLARFTGVGGSDLDGTVTAQEIDLELPSARPERFTLATQARLYGDRLELSDARVLSPELAVRASGRVGWRGGTTVDLTVAVDGTGAFLDRVGYLDGEIRGPVHAEGTFGYRARVWSWRADVSSPGLDLFGFPVAGLGGVATGDREAVRFEIERGDYAGGGLAGTFEVGLERSLPARLDLGVEGADLQSVLDRFDLPVRGLGGRVRGELEFAFELGRALQGTGVGTFEISPAPRSGLPAEGRAALQLARGRLLLPSFALTTPGQRVTGTAQIDLADDSGRVVLDVGSEDLGELVRIVEPLDAGALWAPSAGRGAIAVTLDLTRGGTLASARLDLVDVVAPGARAEHVRGDLLVSERAVERLELVLERGAGRLDLDGRVPLGERDRSLALDLVAEGWPVEDARPWLPFELPLAGRVHGRLRLGGSLAALEGSLAGTVEPARVAGLDGQRLDLTLTFDDTAVEVERALLVAEAGEVAARGRLTFDTPAGDSLDFALESAGLDLALPPFGLDRARAAGRLVFEARVAGTLEAPEAALDGRVEGLTVAGAAFEEASSPVTLRWTRGRVEAEARLGELASIAGGGEYAPAAPARLAFRFQSDRLERLVALAGGAPVEGLTGRLDADLMLVLDPAAPPRVEFASRALELAYGERRVEALEPVRGVVDAEGLRLTSLYLGLPGGEDELFVAGRVAFGERPALDLNLQASLATDWLRATSGDRPALAGLEGGGRIDALARVRGTPARPSINGQAEWRGGRYVPPSVPHSFEDLRGLALFYPDAVVVDRVSAVFAGGRVNASGRIDLPTSDRPFDYRLEIAAREIAPRWPAGWQLRGDADLTLTGGAEARQVRGELRLDRIWYLQDLELSPAQLVQRLLSRGRLEVVETDEALASTSLAIAVRGPGAVRIRNNLARLSGDAELALRGTLASPVLFGEVTLEPGGTVEYAGNTYTIERGRVMFVNPARIEPLLDVVARARVDQYGVTVNLAGPLERLNTTFASDPPLPDLDILGLLATGAPVSGPAFSEIAPDPAGEQRSVAAEALLYGQAASLLTARVGRLFGFDRVRVEPLTSGDTVSAARVTVGKRLSRQLYVTYSLDPSSTAQQILQAEWRLSDRLVLVLTQNGDESYAVDARWESRF